MIVLDASVVVELLRGAPARAPISARIAREPRPFHAPHLLDAEVVQVFRGLTLGGLVSAPGGFAAVQALGILPLRRHAHGPLLNRCWTLRANLTAYDALYVALAERLGATLLTRDARLAKAPGLQAPVEVV